MFIMGVVLLVLAVLRCYRSALTVDRNFLLLHQAAAFVFFAMGAYWTTFSPYILWIGATLFFLSLLRFIGEPYSTAMRRAGYLSAVAALLIIVVNLFQNPSEDETENEDR